MRGTVGAGWGIRPLQREERRVMKTGAMQAKLKALADQNWQAMADRLVDIDRIADGGFDDSYEDHMLVRAVFHTAAGDIHRRAHEVLAIKDGG